MPDLFLYLFLNMFFRRNRTVQIRPVPPVPLPTGEQVEAALAKNTTAPVPQAQNTTTQENPVKTYRSHRCNRQHRTPRTFANCTFPRAEWITGNGPYAVLAWCSVLTITLWPTQDEAQLALDTINHTACGGRCAERHELVYLDATGERS